MRSIWSPTTPERVCSSRCGPGPAESFGHPLEAVSARKQAQVIRAARLYLDAEAPHASGYRFDVVGVLFSATGGEAQLFHVPNAFDTTR